MNNEENNSNIFFSKPNDNLSKPDLMASMPNQNSGPDLMNQTPNLNQTTVNQPTNLIAEPNQINKSFVTNNSNNDEELLKAYIGKNYEKITNNKFNFSAFFFNAFYLCYRKMALLGILVFTINAILCFFVNPLLSIVFNIVIGATFNKLYLKKAGKKINKIKSDNLNATGDTLIALCTDKGGVSIVRIILGSFVIIVIAFITVMIAVMMGAVTIFGNLFKDFADKTADGLNGNYNGVLIYDSSVNIKDEFSITPVGPFQDESEEYSYEYKFENEEGARVFKDCSFSLNAVQGFSDGSTLVKQMSEYDSDNITDNLSTQVLNDINWTWFSKTNGIGTTYYYGTTKNNKAYLFQYEVQEDTSPDCASYRETILNSIIEK